MTRLEPALQTAWAAWRTELGYARSSARADRRPAELERRTVTVIVTFSGSIEALREAGLETGYNRGGRVSGRIAFADLERLDQAPGVVSIAKEPNFRPRLESTVKEMRVPWKVPPTTPWPGKGVGVIVAVIDTGIDVFHRSFRKADAAGSTRILELWDHGATTGGSAPPPAFSQDGRVYSAADINAGIAGSSFPSVDEDGHGTHVAGIAAGNGRQDDRCSDPGTYVGVAPEADLVIVKTIGVSGGTTADALNWCAQARTRHPGNKPVVINCSFGFDTGPHDGTSASDKEVDDLLRPAGGPPAGLAIVVSAGNAGDAEIHEAGTIPGNGNVTISFYVEKGSRELDDLDIWYNGTATLDIEIIAPVTGEAGPTTTGTLSPSAATHSKPIGTTMTVDVTSAAAPMADHNNKKEISVKITPTTTVRSGIWQMKLTETAGVEARWDAWFATELSDTNPTFRMPTDSTPTPRRRNHTINEPGTSRNAITVASYSDDGSLDPTSSRGPEDQTGVAVGEFKPTIAAPGANVTSARSRDYTEDPPSSCCDQLVVDMGGTSMAAPHVTGLVALMFEKNSALTFEQVRGHLQHAARIDGIPSAEVPPVFDALLNIRANHLWGSGKVDAAAALAEMPAAQGGGGGGGPIPGPISFRRADLGFTPRTLVSTLSDWQHRFGPRPGLMLVASLISEHVDEVLRLVNHNRRVGAVWRRRGGPALVRRLLHGPSPQQHLLPRVIDGCDVAELLAGFLPVLDRFAGPRLRSDIARFGAFAAIWPGAGLDALDRAALESSRSS